MFKEVMIDPELWGDWGFSSSVFPQLGVDSGSLLSAFPKKKSQLSDAYRSIAMKIEGKPRRKEKLKARAREALENRSVKNPYRDNQSTGDWWAIVSEELRRYPVDVLFTEKEGLNSLSPDDVADDAQSWKCPQTAQIKKSPDAMILAVLPLMSLSRRLILVDKYFDPMSRRFNPFCSKLMKEVFKLDAISRVDFHYSKNEMSENYLKGWVQNITNGLPRNLVVNFYKWNEDDLHYRAILSDVAGLSSEYGFDTRAQVDAGLPADSSIFSRLSDSDYRDILGFFTNSISLQDREVCRYEVTGGVLDGL